MRAKLLTPERSVSKVYEDDRFKEKFVIVVRQRNTVEILRHRTWDEAETARTGFKRQGYRNAKVPKMRKP